MTMNLKPKPPAKPAPKAKTNKASQPAPNPLLQADNRWQRTVRYGWDNGGKRGGGKAGR